jgi:hypothetical protein
MNLTSYDIRLRLPGEIREWRAEGEVPESEAEVLAAIAELPKTWQVARILKCDYDIAPEDVTESLWQAAFNRWRDEGHDPRHDTLPAFLRDHAPAHIDLGYRPRRAA